jgi:peroxiredoxin
MARAGRTVLDSGDLFPQLEYITTIGEKVSLPRDLKGTWSVLLFYRGHW